MYLFRELFGIDRFDLIIIVIVVVIGMRQWCKWLTGNAVLRGAAKKGALSLFSRLLK